MIVGKASSVVKGVLSIPIGLIQIASKLPFQVISLLLGRREESVSAFDRSVAVGDYESPSWILSSQWIEQSANTLPICGFSAASIQQLAQQVYSELVLMEKEQCLNEIQRMTSQRGGGGASSNVSQERVNFSFSTDLSKEIESRERSILLAVQTWHGTIELAQALSMMITRELHAVMRSYAYWQIVAASSLRCYFALYIHQGVFHLFKLMLYYPVKGFLMGLFRFIFRRKATSAHKKQRRAEFWEHYNARHFVYKKLMACTRANQKLAISLDRLHEIASRLLLVHQQNTKTARRYAGTTRPSRPKHIHIEKSASRIGIVPQESQKEVSEPPTLLADETTRTPILENIAQVTDAGDRTPPPVARLGLEETSPVRPVSEVNFSLDDEDSPVEAGQSVRSTPAVRLSEMVSRLRQTSIPGIRVSDGSSESSLLSEDSAPILTNRMSGVFGMDDLDIEGLTREKLLGMVTHGLCEVKQAVLSTVKQNPWEYTNYANRRGSKVISYCLETEAQTMSLMQNTESVTSKQLLDAIDNMRELVILDNRNTRKNRVGLIEYKSLRRPSFWLRNWPRISLGAYVSAKQLQRLLLWIASGDAVIWFEDQMKLLWDVYQVNVKSPLLTLMSELGKTFRQQDVVTERDLEIETEALHRMLDSYANISRRRRKHSSRRRHRSDPVLTNEEAERAMRLVLHEYEKQMKNPLRSALFGKLPRLMLIQVQKSKVEMQAALLTMDRILQANQLTFAFVAALPGIFILGTILAGSFSLVSRFFFGSRRTLRGSATLPLRLALIEVDRCLQQVESIELTDRNQDLHAELFGLFIYRVERMYKVASMLFQSGEIGSLNLEVAGTSEWKSLQVDLTQLMDPRLSLAAKRSTLDRMSNLYESLRTF